MMFADQLKCMVQSYDTLWDNICYPEEDRNIRCMYASHCGSPSSPTDDTAATVINQKSTQDMY